MQAADMAAARAAVPREVEGMPTFDTLPLNEARANSATGLARRSASRIIGYIRSVSPGLVPCQSECDG